MANVINVLNYLFLLTLDLFSCITAKYTFLKYKQHAGDTMIVIGQAVGFSWQAIIIIIMIIIIIIFTIIIISIILIIS